MEVPDEVLAWGRSTVTARVEVSQLRPALLMPPVSKSDAHRALVLAAVTGRKLDVDLGQAPEDVRVIAEGLTGLSGSVDCRDGGAPFRFLVAQAAVRPGGVTRFTGSARLGERPHRALFESLREALGPEVIREGSPWPVEVRGADPVRERVFRIDPRQSSQFASALLLAAAARAHRDDLPWTVELTGPATSEGYLEMTLDWLERFGFGVKRSANRFEITADSKPTHGLAVPGDWSSLGYLLLVAWASGGEVARVDPAAAHPDRAILQVLEEVGLRVTYAGGVARVEGDPRSGLGASGLECPDLLPTLAALACILPEPSVLTDVGILRDKESDRLEGIQELVEVAGGRTELDGDSLRIIPPERVLPLRITTRGDHRRAMSAAVLAVLGRVPLELDDPGCVAKSFPGFWDELAQAGAELR